MIRAKMSVEDTKSDQATAAQIRIRMRRDIEIPLEEFSLERIKVP